jgi:hypothetical protein
MEISMRRIFTIVACAVVALAGAGLTPAQGTVNPRVGTWRLNLAKSNFAGMPAPKSETRTVEAQGNGEKVTFDGVAADGSRIALTRKATDPNGQPITQVLIWDKQ